MENFEEKFISEMIYHLHMKGYLKYEQFEKAVAEEMTELKEIYKYNDEDFREEL